MDITPLLPKGKQVITGYGGGNFRINGIAYTTSLLILPSGAEPWKVTANAAITLESLQPVIDAPEGDIELLLIGCAKNQMLLPPKIKMALKEAGIALDVMDTGAACRTFNVLVGEGRRVAAAVVVV
jgi:uncharacterized protein